MTPANPVMNPMLGPGWMPSVRPTLSALLSWHPQPVPVFLVCGILAWAAYLHGVLKLRRRGDRWPAQRTACFSVGIVTIVGVTATGIGGYGMETFSVHMVQHMVLSMLSPIFILLGAPITLMLRCLPTARHEGRANARSLLVGLLHSRFARLLSSPIVSLPLFLASLYGLYFTSVFDLAMSSWWTHDLMLAHFLAVGLLFFWPIVGIDPAPHRPAHAVRLMELVIGMPFHAFFGIAVMSSSALFVNSFKTSSLMWQWSAQADQATGGGIAWAFSEVPTIIVLLALVAQWQRFDERTARRSDRAADRDGNADLVAYNRYLNSLDHNP